MTTGYRFVLEVQDLDGIVLHSEAIDPDWEPALEAVRLLGLRTRGVWPPIDDARPQLEPIWQEGGNGPNLRGFRIRLDYEGLSWAAEFPAAKYFGDAARSVVSTALAGSRVKAEERVRYGVAAYEVGDERVDARVTPFTTAPRVTPLNVRDRGFETLVSRAQPCGDLADSDLGVVLPAGVLDEVCRLTLDAGERETGGVLLGHLCRRGDSGDIGLEVTAQVPARHTVGDAVKLTFTSDTWTDARAAVALRKADELFVGWWHSHPAQGWCKDCPIERQKVCQLGAGFLSPDDRALHRAMFPGAYTQALLVTNSINGLDTKLFGWKDGILQHRGFWMLDAGAADSAAGRH